MADDDVTPTPSQQSPSTTPAPDGELTVVVADGAGGSQTWTLTCAPDGTAGGDHPDGVNACAALAGVSAPFAPVPKDMACTMIYGGPQTATVRGTWNGAPVEAAFRRTDGCETARWNKIAPLFEPGAAAGSSRGAT